MEAIEQHGLTPLHRLSFGPCKREMGKNRPFVKPKIVTVKAESETKE
jgi:hypothetical protein